MAEERQQENGKIDADRSALDIADAAFDRFDAWTRRQLRNSPKLLIEGVEKVIDFGTWLEEKVLGQEPVQFTRTLEDLEDFQTQSKKAEEKPTEE